MAAMRVLAKILRKSLHCDCNVKRCEGEELLLVTSGDRRLEVGRMLVTLDICARQQIVLHGGC